MRQNSTSNPFRGESLFARTGPAGQALSPLYPEGKGDLGESGGAPLQVKRGRGSFRKTFFYDNCWSFMVIAVYPKTVRLRTLNIKFKHTFMEIIKTSIDNVLIINLRVIIANKIQKIGV